MAPHSVDTGGSCELVAPVPGLGASDFFHGKIPIENIHTNPPSHLGATLGWGWEREEPTLSGNQNCGGLFWCRSVPVSAVRSRGVDTGG